MYFSIEKYTVAAQLERDAMQCLDIVYFSIEKYTVAAQLERDAMQCLDIVYFATRGRVW